MKLNTITKILLVTSILLFPSFGLKTSATHSHTFEVQIKITRLYLAVDGDTFSQGELDVWYDGYRDNINDREDYLKTDIDGETVTRQYSTWAPGAGIQLKLTDKDWSYQDLLIMWVFPIYEFSGYVDTEDYNGYGQKEGTFLNFGGGTIFIEKTECIPNPGYGTICNGFDFEITIVVSGGGGCNPYC